jgi:ABC-type antimicrobial peptide transport system permease subunit
VSGVGAMSESILSGRDNQAGYSWRGQETDKDYLFKSPRISYDAIETLGLKVVAGRSFSRAFKDEGSKLILNESAVKKMELANPVGKTIKNGDNSLSEVIGVVQDFQYGSIHQRIEPLIFRFQDTRAAETVMVRIKPGATQNTIPQIESLYKKFHPAFPFEFSFLDSDYQALYAAEQKVGILSRYFAILAIIISCLGLFGLAAFTAVKRQKEIGIRKVVGASVGNIVLMLSKDFLKLVGVALLIAFPFSWWAMSGWLQRFAYRVDIGVVVFLAAGISILAIALLTVGYQAIKAAIANPVKSLRTE